ncbi:MAG: hypothetical protein U0105_16235 [Candidatus Obscuribacterales bacterium]|jgi:hypothetical protein
MRCHLYTVGALIGVLAICAALYTASWQTVLLGFAVAGAIWAVYSWRRDSQKWAPPKDNVISTEGRFPRRRDNVYELPALYPHTQQQ